MIIPNLGNTQHDIPPGIKGCNFCLPFKMLLICWHKLSLIIRCLTNAYVCKGVFGKRQAGAKQKAIAAALGIT